MRHFKYINFSKSAHNIGFMKIDSKEAFLTVTIVQPTFSCPTCILGGQTKGASVL